MEKYIFNSAQAQSLRCDSVDHNWKKDEHAFETVIQDKPIFTTDLLDYLPNALEIHGAVCILVLLRTFIPQDPLDPSADSGWIWQAGYTSQADDDFEVVGIGRDMADALFELWSQLRRENIVPLK